jgi:cell wall-associated NlpC family hydrolase
MVPPHVFGARISADEVVAALKGERGTFVSNSLFLQRLMRAAGWDVGYERTADLPTHGTYGPVDVSRAGDLVVYTQDGAAYHVGVLERDGKVVSATLNGGIVRASLNGFLGEVQYLRLLATARLPATPTIAPEPAVE